MVDHFDPSEARDPHGKWVKLAQGLKRLSQEDHSTVVKAIGELPKGGQGNRTSIKGVEIRRHQSGAVNIKIGGESRQYANHEDAARAVIRREHGMPSADSGKPSATSQLTGKPIMSQSRNARNQARSPETAFKESSTSGHVSVSGIQLQLNAEQMARYDRQVKIYRSENPQWTQEQVQLHAIQTVIGRRSNSSVDKRIQEIQEKQLEALRRLRRMPGGR